MKKILIENNIDYVLKNHKKDLLYLNLDNATEIKTKRNHLLCEEIRELNYNIKTLTPQDNINFDIVYSTNAYNENKKYKNLSKAYNNYLFDHRPLDTIPNSFTAFRKKVEKELPTFFKIDPPVLNNVKNKIQLYYENNYPSTYFQTRNQLCGENNFSTNFSIHLCIGAVDVKHLYNMTKQYENKVIKNKSTYWIVFELLWREYFYWHYQEYKESYFSLNGIKGEKQFSSETVSIDEIRTMTDEPFIIAALNQLEQTGYHSNRVRQIFASYLINNLNIPWILGAKLYEKHLIDYDVFSNYGNWMYLSGMGCDPRGKRLFNISKQLKTYDPKNEYLKKYLH